MKITGSAHYGHYAAFSPGTGNYTAGLAWTKHNLAWSGYLVFQCP